MNFLGFFFLMYHYHHSIHGVNFFPTKKEKGGCPLMIPPREGNEAKRPF